MTPETISQAISVPEPVRKPLAVRLDQPHTSPDGGAVLLKAAEKVYGLVAGFVRCLVDCREPGKVRHTLADLLGPRIWMCTAQPDPQTDPGHEVGGRRGQNRSGSSTIMLTVVGAGDCVAGGRFAESAVVSGPGRDRGGGGSLDAVAHPAADRLGNARGGFHVGSGAAVRCGSGTWEAGRHRCDGAGSERGDAEHRAAGHGSILRGVHSAVGRGVRGRDADPGGFGSV